MTNNASIPPRIARLVEVAGREERRILGLMSGTSLDGLDLALCRIRGHGSATAVELLHHRTLPYTPPEQAMLREVVSVRTVSLERLCRLHGWLAWRHGRMVLESLAAWGEPVAGIDCLASHGQTVYHAPAGAGTKEPYAPAGAGTKEPYAPAGPGQQDFSVPAGQHSTLQIGDGDRLALTTGILTLSDFRQKEIAAGGQGAPMAPYADALLFGGGDRGRVLLNLGGIANFTWLPARGDARRPLCGDTGPANTLIDRAVRRAFPRHGAGYDNAGYDKDGTLAAAGTVHQALLARLKAHPYFGQALPKSTGPELFGAEYLDSALAAAAADGIPGEDLVATLTRLTVETVVESLQGVLGGRDGTVEIFVSGGGAHNRTLMAWLREALPGVTWGEFASLGIPADAKEAVLFAVLANETLAGAGFVAPFGAPEGPLLGFGKVSFPD